MCGVLGFFSKEDNNSVFNKNLIKQLSAYLKHRGPDKTNYLISENKDVYIGHTRLSILDLSDKGSQPMEIPNGRYAISYNGEIYNHLELRKELNFKEQYNWVSQCDTETLLLCFEQWGIQKTLLKIDGMFSIILHDKLLNKISLIRDRYGEKPLYYGLVGKFLVFASELKIFKNFPNFDNLVSSRAVSDYLKYNFIPSPLTVYQNIFKVEQGSFVEFDLNKKINIDPNLQVRWYTPLSLIDSNYEKELNLLDENQLIYRCDKLINDSVNSRLISDVPIGVFLSGGVDSSLISYYAAKNSDRLNTYSVSFDEKKFNESSIAKKTSIFLNSNHHEFKFDSNIFFEFVNKLVNIYDEPFSDISQIPTTYLSYMVSKDVKVALSGDGGDEFFGGYKKYLWGKKIWSKLSWMKFESRVRLGNYIKKYIIENNYLPQLLNKKFISNLSQISKRLINVKDNNDLYNSLISNLYFNSSFDFHSSNLDKVFEQINNLNINRLDNSQQMMFYDILFTFSNGILCKLDRAAMNSSLETRLPFLNTDLNKFAINLPSKYKIRNNQNKYILKKLLYSKFNSNHFTKVKTGFGIPISLWLRNEIKNWSQEIVYNGDKNKLFDNKYYRKLWNYHQIGYDNSSIIWNNIIFNLWSYS